MAERVFGIGIIGAGRISGAHARAAGEAGSTRLVMASEVDDKRAHDFEAKWHVPVVSDYMEVLNNPEVDIVSLTLRIGCMSRLASQPPRPASTSLLRSRWLTASRSVTG